MDFTLKFTIYKNVYLAVLCDWYFESYSTEVHVIVWWTTSVLFIRNCNAIFPWKGIPVKETWLTLAVLAF